MGGTHSGAALGIVCVSADALLLSTSAGACRPLFLNTAGEREKVKVLGGSLAPARPSEHLAGWATRVGGAGPGLALLQKGGYHLPVSVPLLGLPWGCSLLLCLMLHLRRGCWEKPQPGLALGFS